MLIDENVAELGAKKICNVHGGIEFVQAIGHRRGQSDLLSLLIYITPETFRVSFEAVLQTVLERVVQTIIEFLVFGIHFHVCCSRRVCTVLAMSPKS